MKKLFLGTDVGSTTVKIVCLDRRTMFCTQFIKDTFLM